MRGNTADLDAQPFYRFIQRTYAWHVVGMFAALYAFGGLPALVWGGALRAVWVYHITWFVNSASHCWGYQVGAPACRSSICFPFNARGYFRGCFGCIRIVAGFLDSFQVFYVCVTHRTERLHACQV